ncbi:MAG: NAD-dependent epimerase [Candidatus Riflebacteria bacterium]|nr:NAD-dependent epimerase [Candidatus Riflebacteria bacterium]
MKILVTGAAGFIGFHLSCRLLERGDSVLGFDNLNPYYDVTLKEARLNQLTQRKGFFFVKGDLVDRNAIEKLFSENSFDRVINLAAQAGVRYSLTNPYVYIDSNIVGFINILEACRHSKVPHLVFASSSSVYGSNTKFPFSIHDNVDHPISLYAATKRTNELMAHTYSHLYQLPTTGLRFFTGYGPWGRPDMALFLFTKAIFEGKPIEVYNNGKMQRDFTYIDDIVEGLVRVTDKIPEPNPNWDGMNPDPATSFAPYRIYNIGNQSPIGLTRFIEIIEEKLGKKAIKIFLPIQPGDVPTTFADVEDLKRDVDFIPATPPEVGVEKFVDWYLSYYKP